MMDAPGISAEERAAPPRMTMITRDDGWIFLTACLIPAMPVICLTLEWLVACLWLRHIPRPILDDPRHISGLCSSLHALTFLSVIAFFPASIGVMVAGFLACGSSRRGWGIAAAVVFLAAGSIAVWSLNPFKAVQWWLIQK